MNDRFHRQVLMFGEEGQSRLRAVRVGIVGLGGLGAHVAQQLSHLGVTSFFLVDPDRVEQTNLNRLVGATQYDVEAGRTKVDVAERVIRASDPDAVITSSASTFVGSDGIESLVACDFVFGCVDNDGSRLILNEICQAHDIPYLDLATDVHIGDDGRVEFGGRTLLSVGGGGCVVCHGLLDEDEIRFAFMSPSARADDQAIYGVPRDTLGQAGPAVVSLNGLIASIGVTEFIMLVTRIRPPRRALEYNGMRGVVLEVTDPPAAHCYYCAGRRGTKTVDLSQYGQS